MNFPFKFKPETRFINIGDEKSGIIEVEFFNDITISEQIEFEEKTRKIESEVARVLTDLVVLIAKENAIGFDVAHDVIFNPDQCILPNNKDARSIRLKYLEGIGVFSAKAFTSSQEKQFIGASLMVRRAISPLESFVENLQNNLKIAKNNEEKGVIIKQIEEYEKQIDSLRKWSVEDTKKSFRQSTLKILYEFFLKESNGGEMPEIEEVGEGVIAKKEPQTIEAMGKPVEESPQQIGEKSITESKTTSQEKKDSPGKTSQETKEV